MGKYNPYRPMILGNEWAGIRPEPYQLDPETERGHTFTLNTTTTVVSGSVFLDNNPTWASYFNGPVLAIYPRGDEADAGPTRKVTIPCGGVLIVTGTGLQPTIVPGSATGVQAVASMSDDAYILFAGDYPTNATSQMRVRFAFNVSSVSSVLTNKRILDVNIVYVFTGDSGSQVDLINSNIINQVGLTDPDFPDLEITVSNVSGGSSIGWESKPYINATPNHITGPSYASIGNLNVMGSATAPAPHRIYPWTYNDLLRFGPGFGTGQLYVNVLGSQLFNSFSTTSIPANIRYNPAYLTYIALEVTYCDEKRLAYGGVYGRQSSSPNNGPNEGQNIVHMRTANTATPGITLPAGDYTATLTTGHNEPRLGTDNTVRKVTYVTDALRQAYALPTHRGVEIRRTLVENDVMTSREIDVLPQLMLHTTSGPVTGVHAYGTQLGTDIYDTVTLQQRVLQESGGAAVPFPQVRFYARRFGNTDVPLLFNRPAVPTNAVSITPNEFDALPEIVDGWREVTLRFPVGNIPTFANNSTTMTWEWSASGLTAGDQWQVLTPRSESIGGAFDTSPATFAGTTGFVTYNGNVFGSADATILFSQDPPAVTGLAVTPVSLPVTGIGEDCGPTREVLFSTEFDYVVTGGLGSGWTTSGGTAADYEVDGADALITVNATLSQRGAFVLSNVTDSEQIVTFSTDELAVGSRQELSLMARRTDDNNVYLARFKIQADQTVLLDIQKRVGGVQSPLTVDTAVAGLVHAANTDFKMRFRVVGTTLATRAWSASEPEPVTWHVTGTDTDLVSGSLGVRAILGGGYTSPPTVFAIDSYYADTGADHSPACVPTAITYHRVTWLPVATDPVTGFGYYELQRDDDVTNEWQTIMKATSPSVTGFNDYEARVGVESQYRIRVGNVYDFVGSWSSTVTSTIPAPGVTVSGDGNSVLIFTANDDQSGNSNLAHTMTWDSNVAEDFEFPEANAVQFRTLYQRDYVMALRPTERGGERFSRLLLINNAATVSGRIRDGFTSLRDMAWAQLSYVCVRNELGDRWFAAVQVPSGRIQRNRTLYLSRVDITEVTNTPSQTDPAA
jgi:hypothetical protein